MPFSVRIGSMLVVVDTVAEVAELARAFGETPGAPAKRPMGSGEIIETAAGWKIRARVGGERVSRAGFKSPGEAEAALAALVETGVAPALKRHRRARLAAERSESLSALPALPAAPIPPPTRALVHAFDAPTNGVGFAKCGAGNSESLRITGVASAVTCPECTRLISEEASIDVAADTFAPRGHRWITKKASAYQLPPGPAEKKPYHRAASEGMKAYWARRRAEKAQAAAPTPAPAIEPPPLPPAVITPKLPPRCGRCLRVGHVETECPNAGLAAAGGGGARLDENDSPTVSASPESGDSASMTRAAEVEGEDDDSTDLTDLVDVPDADPTPLPPDVGEAVDFNRGKACGTCGKPGHISITCPSTAAIPAERATHSAPPRAALVHFCLEAQRPCPRTTCRFHLGPERPDLPLDQLPESCTLDVVDRGPATLEEIGAILDVTRERVRQIEAKGLDRMARYARRHGIDFEIAPERRSNAPEDSL